MKAMLKVLIAVAIAVGTLLAVKLGLDLWSKNVKKYFLVENND